MNTTTEEHAAWLRGFAAVLASTYRFTHDKQNVRQALLDHGVWIDDLEVAGVDDFDLRVIREAAPNLKREMTTAQAPAIGCVECGAAAGEPCCVVTYGFAGRGPKRVTRWIRSPHDARIAQLQAVAP